MRRGGEGRKERAGVEKEEKKNETICCSSKSVKKVHK